MPSRRETDIRLAAILRQCAAACDRALTHYITMSGLDAEHELVREVVSAMSAVATAADYVNADAQRRRVALMLVVDVCRSAARTCRHYGLDKDLLACAAACELAASQASLVLGSTAA